MSKGYAMEAYEALYDITRDNSPMLMRLEALASLHHDQVCAYRVKEIRSGSMAEMEIFPVISDPSTIKRVRKAVTREVQRKLNARNSQKKASRLMNTNFDENDTHAVLSYHGDQPNYARALKDIQSYIKDLRKHCRKNGLPELKYMYAIEYATDAEDNGLRIHHHLICNVCDTAALVALWDHGRVRPDPLQPDAYEFTGLGHYIGKRYEAKGKPRKQKTWRGSRNLSKPDERESDAKISRRRAERIAKGTQEAASVIFEKLYPTYEFIDCEVRRSLFAPGAYIYARLRRRNEKSTREGRKWNNVDRAGRKLSG